MNKEINVRETILVVDDSRDIANFTAFVLLPNLGYDALVAYDGQSGLESLRKFPISLVLLDLELPDMNGMDMLRLLVKQGRTIPVILITAHGSEQIATEAFRLGIQDYLTKPLDADELGKSINRVLTVNRMRQEKNRLAAQLQERVNWQSVLSRVGQSVTSTLDHDEVLRRIVEAGVVLTRADEGFLALLDEKTNQLYLRAVKNIDETKIKTMRLPVTDQLVSKVFKTGTPLRTSEDAETNPLKVSTGFLVHSLLYIPLISKGKTLGVLAADMRTQVRPFTDTDEALLMSLADYATIAIENARLYEQAQQDILERKRVTAALRVSQERYALAMSGANDGLWDWDLKTQKIYFSTRWKAQLGFDENEIGDKTNEWFDRVHAEDIERLRRDMTAHIKGVTSHFENEHRVRHLDGSYRWMLSRGCAVWDDKGNATRIAGSQTDITNRKFAEEKLLFDAFHDRLTGLPNRALFTDRLRYAVERAKRRGEYMFAVLFLDLDRFKDVNDSLGHMVGDQLLVTISRKMEAILRPTDTVARLGGDEFVILIEDITDIRDATRVADRIQQGLCPPFNLGGRQAFITTSIGIVLSSTGYSRPEDVLRDADIALYRAKERGRNRYEVFDPAMRDQIIERLEMESELRQAIERLEFRIDYMPIAALKTGRLCGFEALIRWQHPTRGLLQPADFVKLAEDTGLVITTDRWVMREACKQVKAWQEIFQYDPPITISVNLTSRQLAQTDFLEFIQNVLDETKLSATCLKLEITENTIMDVNERTAQVLADLRKMNIHIQIDDFGIGYSSLSYLSNFPVNALKIDRSFVSAMELGNHNLRIVQAIVMLTQGLGLSVIAEGLETEKQLQQLLALGCEYGQGTLVSRPLPPEKVHQLLQDTHGQVLKQTLER